MKEEFVANREVNDFKSDRVSITPSGFFGKHAGNIQSRENFMTEEELTKVSEFARNIKFWDLTETHYNEDGTIIYDSEYWKDRVATYKTLHAHDPNIIVVLENMIDRLKIEVDKFFSVDASPTPPAIVRWLPGQLQMPHADKELHDEPNVGVANDFPYYDIAGLFYLNDDYDGGELYFPRQGIEFKPKPGGAYFFPGDRFYIHGVREITSGMRYVVPFFFTVMGHKKEHSNASY
jgi:hypothetical protein